MGECDHGMVLDEVSRSHWKCKGPSRRLTLGPHTWRCESCVGHRRFSLIMEESCKLFKVRATWIAPVLVIMTWTSGF